MELYGKKELNGRPLIKPCNVNFRAVWEKFGARAKVSDELNAYLLSKIATEKVSGGELQKIKNPLGRA